MKNDNITNFENYNPLGSPGAKNALSEYISTGILSGALIPIIESKLSDNPFNYSTIDIVMSYVKEFDLKPDAANLNSDSSALLDLIVDLEHCGVNFLFYGSKNPLVALYAYACFKHASPAIAITHQNFICLMLTQGRVWGLEYNYDARNKTQDKILKCLDSNGFTLKEAREFISNVKQINGAV